MNEPGQIKIRYPEIHAPNMWRAKLDAIEADLSEFCSEKCEGLNGGYFADNDGDCCQFIVCQLTQSRFGPGQYIGYKQTCMYPLVWDSKNGACNNAKDVEGCTEECHTPPSPTPPFTTQMYNESGQCYRNNKLYSWIESDPQCFFVDDNMDELVCCGIDRVFDLEECGCVGTLAPSECDCILCLPFVNNRVQDIIHDTYTEVRGVSISDAGVKGPGDLDIFKGCFDGVDDYIRISNFIKLYYGPTFSISFSFYVDPAYDTRKTHGIISNGCCDEEGSIKVNVLGESLNVRFETEFGVYEEDILEPAGKRLTPGTLTDVTLRYCGPTLDVFYDGELADTRILGGDLLTTDCALTIGQDGDKGDDGGENTNFQGCIVNFSVCRDCWTDEQVNALAAYDEASIICEQLDELALAGAI
ncbi:unnamed protein product [Owenia fusiformis]|uniref:Chitin-binding type-2 domain-containing protein n=1 Tax=Owenia fusiformis TaxID=6347 RepID=A0A8S4NF02_OWEFU|nr:unnamed protein product [Owenia fusiformis]